MPSSLLTEEVVLEVIRFIDPGIRARFEEWNRTVVSIVVLDPVETIWTAGPNMNIRRLPVLFSGVIGENDPRKWKMNYTENAKRKALLSWRTRLDSHLVMRDCPHLLQAGDFRFGGSVYRHGLVVGASGLRWDLDLMVSDMVVAGCRALCLAAKEAIDANPKYRSYTMKR